MKQHRQIFASDAVSFMSLHPELMEKVGLKTGDYITLKVIDKDYIRIEKADREEEKEV